MHDYFTHSIELAAKYKTRMEKYGGKDLLRCSDPFKKHKKIVKKDLRDVTITLRKNGQI